MNNLRDVGIVIPIYRDFLDEFEKKSLESIITHFNEFEIIFVAPLGLTVEAYKGYLNKINNYRIEYFEKDCFSSIDAYNKLLLDSEFYQRFSDYYYILICQLDVYVFHNKLIDWCKKDYDYVGAPWIGSERNIINLTLDSFNAKIRLIRGKKQKNTERLFRVGNGGFSLRKVDMFISISQKEKENIQLFLEKKPDSEYYIEDVFWSLYVTKIYNNYRIPEWKEALSFCMDRKPIKAMRLNNNQLPMACHRFNQPKLFKFWKKYINEF